MSLPLLLLLMLASSYASQAAPDRPEDVVSLWFDRVNALDGTEQSVDALLSLYRADALHITGPERHQLGAVTFSGHENIRKMARDLLARFEELRYRVEVVTASETSKRLLHVADGPWGGASVAVAYVVAYTRKDDGVRLMVPGAAFFQIQDGKIRRVRQYVASGEEAEVEPLK